MNLEENIVLDTDSITLSLKEFLKQNGILIGGRPPTFRLVLHRDIKEKDIPMIISAFSKYFRS